MIRPLVLLLAIAGSAAPSLAQLPQTTPAVPVPLDGTLLEVTAEGTTTRVPDLATVGAGVVTQAATAAEAFAANAAASARVLAALDRAGVAPRDVQTASVTLQPQYRYRENQSPIVTGYQASNTVTVRLRDVARGGAVVDALVTAGANQVSGPDLSLAEPDAALDEARRDAVRKARARADLYAAAAGMRVARILAISEEGVQTPRPPMPMLRAQAAQDGTQFSPGEQDVTARVAVRFLLR